MSWVGAGMVPGLLGIFGLKYNYMPSPGWWSWWPIGWTAVLASYMLLVEVAARSYRRFYALIPAADRPKVKVGKYARVGGWIILVLAIQFSVDVIYGSLVPRLLHNFAPQQQANVAFTIVDSNWSLRFPTTYEIETAEYGAGEMRPVKTEHYRIGLGGTLEGTQSAFGFYIDTIRLLVPVDQ
jgi:hypothetical protein